MFSLVKKVIGVSVCICLLASLMQKAEAQEYRILVLPSGGATGIIPATLLERLEKETARPVYKLFDEIWGSSIGAMTAALLTTPKNSLDLQNNSESVSSANEPRSAAEVVQFIENIFSHYHRAAHLRGSFRSLIQTSAKLNETLIPIRILSAKVTEWRAGIVPKKTELAAFNKENDGDLSLSSITCGSCSNPPIHRTEPLHLGNGEYSYCIDAGHEFCGSSSCMNPMFTFMKQFSRSIDLEHDTVSLFFLGNGWVNLHSSWGTQGTVTIQGHDDQFISVNLFNVGVELTPAIQEWKRDTWTGWAFGSFQSNYLLNNLAGIGAIPTRMMKRIAEDVAQNSFVFQAMVDYLRRD